MTALEYMEKQVQKHRKDYEREQKRGVPDAMLICIGLKISYYEQAVEALRMEDILLNKSGEIEFDYEAEDV